MFALNNVTVNHGRLKDSPRSRLVDGSGPLAFGWGAQSSRREAYQTACRVRLSGGAFGWDSGWVEQRRQSLEYTGAPLPEGERVALEITIRDDAGNESAPYCADIYSAAVDWRAGWIGAAEDEPGRTLYLRREFAPTRPVRSAVLYACGIGYHKLYLNGEALDAAELDPANTDYAAQCQYVVWPGLEGRLRPGANCLGALVGNGWRRNVLLREEGSADVRAMRYAGRPQLSAMLRLTYENGDTEWLLTDGSWQCGRGAHARNDIFDGETYDAGQSAPGWNLPGFAGFAPAREVKAPGGRMTPMLLAPVVEHRALSPVSVWHLPDGRMMADFGQNLAGVVRLRLPSGMERGRVIRVRHAEELDEDGTLYTAPLRKAAATDTYIASGDGRDLAVWQPIFTYHGFRYVEVSGGLEPDCIEAVELHTDLETRSSFRCGSALATRIHELCAATERANQHSILTDCPQRDERQGWMNDATVRFEETPYNFDVGRMFPKLIRDIIDTQDASGAITCTAPFVFGNQPADPVCSSFLVAGWEAWRHTGNREVLAECFDRFAAWENCLLAHSEGYLVNYSYYGDWAGPEYACSSEGVVESANSAVTPGVFMSTGYSYHNCRLLSGMARELGRSDDAAHWTDMAQSVRAAMLGRWYDAENAVMATGSQACQAFALWLGIIPEADAPRAARRIHDELAANGYRLTTGNLCSRYIMDVLSDNGYLEDAWRLITREEYPSIGYMIQQEATTVWERFELKKNPGMNSHNHPMYAAVDYWFYAYLCGIRPLAPGYERILIKPFIPEKLMSAQAVVDTVRGEVAVRWMKRYGALHLHVTVPFGARAVVEFAGETHEVGSGFYTFSTPCEGV